MITIRVLDIWRQGNDRRLILKNGYTDNRFRIHSPGTGELVREGFTGAQVAAYLMGENPDEWPYLFELNVGVLLQNKLPAYGPFARSVVATLEPDAELLKKMEEERKRQFELDIGGAK